MSWWRRRADAAAIVFGLASPGRAIVRAPTCGHRVLRLAGHNEAADIRRRQCGSRDRGEPQQRTGGWSPRTKLLRCRHAWLRPARRRGFHGRRAAGRASPPELVQRPGAAFVRKILRPRRPALGFALAPRVRGAAAGTLSMVSGPALAIGTAALAVRPGSRRRARASPRPRNGSTLLTGAGLELWAVPLFRPLHARGRRAVRPPPHGFWRRAEQPLGRRRPEPRRGVGTARGSARRPLRAMTEW